MQKLYDYDVLYYPVIMDSLFIFGAKYLFILSFIICGIFFLRLPLQLKKKIILFGAVSLIIIYALALLAGKLYYDPRPFVTGHFTPLIPHSPDNGFPSDHALMISALAAIVYFFKKKVGFLILSIAIVVGIARVYVGVHHSVDVLASIVIAFCGGYFAYLILRKKISI